MSWKKLQWGIRLEFKPRDLWVGVFPKKRVLIMSGPKFRTDVWICFLPMLPIHIWWLRPAYYKGES